MGADPAEPIGIYPRGGADDHHPDHRGAQRDGSRPTQRAWRGLTFAHVQPGHDDKEAYLQGATRILQKPRGNVDGQRDRAARRKMDRAEGGSAYQENVHSETPRPRIARPTVTVRAAARSGRTT